MCFQTPLSKFWVPSQAVQCLPGRWFVRAIPQQRLRLMSFKRPTSLATGVLASLAWWLCCHSPFCHGNYIDDIVFLGWVWYMLFTHTQLLKEMSAGPCRRWWRTPWLVSPHRLGEIKELLKDTFWNLSLFVTLPLLLTSILYLALRLSPLPSHHHLCFLTLLIFL